MLSGASPASAAVLTLTSRQIQDNGQLAELAAALKDHTKGSAGLVTRFRHPE